MLKINIRQNINYFALYYKLLIIRKEWMYAHNEYIDNWQYSILSLIIYID